MLRYRWLLIGAGTCALISAGSLGAGLVGIQPILGSVLGENRKGLPELAADFNARGHSIQIPQALIDQLPNGPFTAITAIIIGLGILTLFGATANFFHEFLSLTVVNRTIAASGVTRSARCSSCPCATSWRSGPATSSAASSTRRVRSRWG